MTERMWDVFLCGSFVDYCYAFSSEEAIHIVAGEDADCAGWEAHEAGPVILGAA